jgi:hypothetical protein
MSSKPFYCQYDLSADVDMSALLSALKVDREGGRLTTLQILDLLHKKPPSKKTKLWNKDMRASTAFGPEASAFGKQVVSSRPSTAGQNWGRQMIPKHRVTLPLRRDLVEGPAPTAYDQRLAMGRQAVAGVPTEPRQPFDRQDRIEASPTHREQQYTFQCRVRRSDQRAMGAQALSHLPSEPKFSIPGGQSRKQRLAIVKVAIPKQAKIAYDSAETWPEEWGAKNANPDDLAETRNDGD